MAKKLRCDRCGFGLTHKDHVDLAFEGMSAWHTSARTRGIEPSGVLPCKNYIRCQGEIVIEKWFPPHSIGDCLTGIKSILLSAAAVLVIGWPVLAIIVAGILST